jgi:hypothetical protein
MKLAGRAIWIEEGKEGQDEGGEEGDEKELSSERW